MRTATRLIDTWLDHPRLDYLVVAAVVALTASFNPAHPVPPGDLVGWYQTLATVTAVLLSLGGIVVTLVFTVTPNDRLAHVYDHVGDRLESIVVSCLGGLVVATIGFALLFLLDDTSERIQLTAVVGLITVSALRFGRLWWVLRRVLKALMARYVKQEDGPDEPWLRPTVVAEDYALTSRRAHRRH